MKRLSVETIENFFKQVKEKDARECYPKPTDGDWKMTASATYTNQLFSELCVVFEENDSSVTVVFDDEEGRPSGAMVFEPVDKQLDMKVIGSNEVITLSGREIEGLVAGLIANLLDLA